MLAAITVQAQYVYKGTVYNSKKLPLQQVKITIKSNSSTAYTNVLGMFEMVSKNTIDTIDVVLAGFEKQTLLITAQQPLIIILKNDGATVAINKPKLISFTKNAERNTRYNPYVSDETYFKLIENEFVKAQQFPHTSFSLNVNKASYSNVRRFINGNSMVPPDAVRIEELINYFNIGYQQPSKNEVFKVMHQVVDCPWNNQNKLLCLNISAQKINIDTLPPSNIVFLIDVSGSMDMPNRLPLLKEAFQLFVKNMRPVDKVSIVTYGGVVGTWLAPTFGSEQQYIIDAIEKLQAAGDTPGEAAIVAAYKLASDNFIPGGNNRVIIATDGDFNVGQTSEKALDALITKQRQTGIYLTCLGVGMGNLKDSKLQTLAKRGNGNYAYLDNLQEAEKVLVHEITETMYAVADDAFINIEFNADAVQQYKLIGFDNKREAIQDATSDVDGGEIGSGSSTFAIFEIIPNSNDSLLNMATLQLKYHDVKDATQQYKMVNYSITSKTQNEYFKDAQLAAAIALFGLKLKLSPFVKHISWQQVKAITQAAIDHQNYLQTAFLALVEQAVNIYEPKKKKKKNLF
ncbi:von Willebrand factor type A domain-containing protein [Ferruginibacter yonginensis]|uniref:von Willebrand factor type A domain-containing protein n=1 Tax=Ferruginibacter yonginensis TaxID=1310416 RepID=A0ABV8QSF4_9BACT